MQRSRGLFSFKKLAIVGGFISFLRLVVLWADNGPTIIDLCTALHLHAPAHRIVGARTTKYVRLPLHPYRYILVGMLSHII